MQSNTVLNCAICIYNILKRRFPFDLQIVNKFINFRVSRILNFFLNLIVKVVQGFSSNSVFKSFFLSFCSKNFTAFLYSYFASTLGLRMCTSTSSLVSESQIQFGYQQSVSILRFSKCFQIQKVFSDLENVLRFRKCSQIQKVFSDLVSVLSELECVLRFSKCYQS